MVVTASAEKETSIHKAFAEDVVLEATTLNRPVQGREQVKVVMAAVDAALFDLAMPLFETEDVQMALPAAVSALKAGKRRPVFDFKGR